MNKSLIFSCQLYYPDSQSTSQLFTAVMEGLALRGHEVKVFCGFPNGAYKNKIPRYEICNGVVIERLGLRLSSKRSFINRALSYTSYMACLLPKLILTNGDCRFFAVTNPPFLAWILSMACLINRKKFIFMFLDLHPEGLIALGALPEKTWYVRLWKYLNGLSYRRAEKLFVLGRDMIPILSRNYRLERSIFRYIPHWSASESKSPISFSESKFPKIWGVSDSFVVQYSGNMGLWHDVDTFVRAAKILELHKEIQFVFVGDGIRKEKAINLSREINVQNIHWKEFVPLNELSESLAGCHLALISLNKNLEGVAVPSKLYGILASGRPVIAQVPQKSEVAITVLENGCGVVVEPGDAKGLADVIYRLSRDVSAVDLMSAAAYNSYCDAQKAIDIFERELLY